MAAHAHCASAYAQSSRCLALRCLMAAHAHGASAYAQSSHCLACALAHWAYPVRLCATFLSLSLSLSPCMPFSCFCVGYLGGVFPNSLPPTRPSWLALRHLSTASLALVQSTNCVPRIRIRSATTGLTQRVRTGKPVRIRSDTVRATPSTIPWLRPGAHTLLLRLRVVAPFARTRRRFAPARARPPRARALPSLALHVLFAFLCELFVWGLLRV